METDFSLNSLRDDVQNCMITPSKMILNDEGLELLKETSEAVRAAILKVNAFKQYIKDQIKECNEQLNINPSLSMIDTKLQVFFTIPDNKITELEVRKALENERFEDFIITIKNRLSHSYGFIKFSTEDAVNRAIDMNQKISVNNLLVKIRPHRGTKKNSATPVTNNEDANNVSQTIDESLLINVSCGYQHRRILSNYSEPVYDEENGTSMNVEPEKSLVHASQPETALLNISHHSTDSAKENLNEDRHDKWRYWEVAHSSEKNELYKPGRHSSENNKLYKPGRHSSENNKFSHKNKDKYYISKKNASNGITKHRPRYFGPDDRKSKRSANLNRNCNRRSRHID